MPMKISNKPILNNGNLQVDGKIDDFVQGNTADCWFLAAVKSLSESKEGKECIKNSIRINKDGTYSVFFQGDSSKKEYRFTQKEIDKANSLSSGDGDTRLLEMAAKKYFENKHEKFEYNGNGQKAYNLLIDKSHKTENVVIMGSLKLAVDRNGRTINEAKTGSCMKKRLVASKHAELEIDRILKEKSANQALPVTVGVNYTPENKKLEKNHAYTVESIDHKSRTMVLIDPHYTGDRLIVSTDNFAKNFMSISSAEGFSQEPDRSCIFKMLKNSSQIK